MKAIETRKLREGNFYETIVDTPIGYLRVVYNICDCEHVVVLRATHADGTAIDIGKQATLILFIKKFGYELSRNAKVDTRQT